MECGVERLVEMACGVLGLVEIDGVEDVYGVGLVVEGRVQPTPF